MFLGTLSDDQKQAFLVLADAVLQADRRLAPQEAEMLTLMRAEMGFPDDVPVPASDVAAAVTVFDCRRSRVAAMLELTGLAFADREIAPEEEAVIGRIGDALGFSQAEILSQREWVFRQMALVHEANAMMLEG